MIKSSIPILFDYRGITYKGWAMPSAERHDDGHPIHYAVELNGSFFGNLRCERGKWITDQRRPNELVVAAGERLSEWLLMALRAFA